MTTQLARPEASKEYLESQRDKSIQDFYDLLYTKRGTVENKKGKLSHLRNKIKWYENELAYRWQQSGVFAQSYEEESVDSQAPIRSQGLKRTDTEFQKRW